MALKGKKKGLIITLYFTKIPQKGFIILIVIFITFLQIEGTGCKGVETLYQSTAMRPAKYGYSEKQKEE